MTQLFVLLPLWLFIILKSTPLGCNTLIGISVLGAPTTKSSIIYTLVRPLLPFGCNLILEPVFVHEINESSKHLYEYDRLIIESEGDGALILSYWILVGLLGIISYFPFF